MATHLISIPIDEISLGVSCSRPIVDESDVLLVGANTRITEHVISGLRDRGINSIEVDPRDVASLKGVKRVKRKKILDSRQSRAAMLSRPLKNRLVNRFEECLNPERGKVIEARLMEASKQIDLIRNQLCTQSLRSVSSLVNLSDQYVDSLVDDQDHAVGILGSSLEDEQLSRRSTRLSVLGMAVAAEVGLNGHKTIEVGLTGLLHDIGLMVMDQSLRQPYEWMSDDERWEYQKHPLVAAACVKNMMEVPHNVLLAMTQLHEQCDGTGFPRGLRKSRIHHYARILNVVDSYLSLTSRSCHRPALVPHDALAFILHQAAKGIFDPEVTRAFLRVESLFPLGCQVELSNGEAATVIRRPKTGFSEPVVSDCDGNRIELENADVRIVRPIINDDSAAVRMTQELMKEIQWSPPTPVFAEATAT
jgi:HD-GYP domain-containing protein (c-di-GMP phosphodiesterase class II)